MAVLADVLLHIELEAMLAIGTQQPHALFEIQNIFMLKYDHLEVVIKNFGQDNKMRVFADFVTLEGSELIEKFLNVFGPVIVKLKYSAAGVELYDRALIEDLITRKCIRLEELFLVNMPERLTTFFGILDSVLKVTFQWSFVPADMIVFNEMFPNAKCISFLGWNVFDRLKFHKIHKYFTNVSHLILCDETHLPLFEIQHFNREINIGFCR